MPKSKVKDFLGRLSNYSGGGGNPDLFTPLRQREEGALRPYRRKNVYPGPSYLYIGESYNLDPGPTGADAERKRKTSIALLFKTKGNDTSCVAVEEALGFSGFPGVLSRFENYLLRGLPKGTLIGPAYDPKGNPLPLAFTVWRQLPVTTKTKKAALIPA